MSLAPPADCLGKRRRLPAAFQRATPLHDLAQRETGVRAPPVGTEHLRASLDALYPVKVSNSFPKSSQ